jgi:DNA polymerase III delta subunit
VSGGLYLLLGPDRHRKLARVRQLERAHGVTPLDRHQLDGGLISPAELLALCRQQPAASPVRLIVVDQAHRLERAGVEALVEQRAVIAQSACVVLLVEPELGARHALFGAVSVFTVERFQTRDASAVNPFALNDALGARDAAGALSACREQLAAGKEPVELLGLIGWQLQRWVAVKRCERTGVPAQRIAEATGMRPWQVERAQREIARRSLSSLEAALERCWRLDLEMKTGRAIPELAVEQFLVELTLGTSPESG